MSYATGVLAVWSMPLALCTGLLVALTGCAAQSPPTMVALAPSPANQPATLSTPWQRYWGSGQPFLAVQALQQAVDQSPNQPALRLELGHYLYATGQTQAAYQQWQHLITHFPQSQAAAQARVWLVGSPPPMTLVVPSSVARSQWSTSLPPRPLANTSQSDTVATLTVGGPDYLAAMLLQGKRVRWALTGKPIAVYIEPAGRFGNSPQSSTEVVFQALSPWLAALGGQLQTVQVYDPAQAQIKVRFIKTVDKQGINTNRGTLYTAGTTQPEFQQGRLVAMAMELARVDVAGKPHDAATLYNTALHEFGHALGLLGHSPNPHDVMHGESSQSAHVSGTRNTLTQADKATIRRLYSEPAQISQLPAETNIATATGKSAPVEVDTQAQALKALETEIAKREQEVQLRGTRLNWGNVGQLYLQRAKLAEGAGQPKEALAWISKAKDASNQAVKADPNAPEAYFSRCVVEQLLQQNDAALKDITKAIALNPTQGRYYLEQAWVYGQLRQRALGLNALDRYRQLPGATTTDPYYQKVKQALTQSGNR
jgi:tetratricopeptide (TPR) repeat protein